MPAEPKDRLLTRAEVERRTGLGRTAIYRMMRAGEFPEPYRVGRTAVRWSELEIEAWSLLSRARTATASTVAADRLMQQRAERPARRSSSRSASAGLGAPARNVYGPLVHQAAAPRAGPTARSSVPRRTYPMRERHFADGVLDARPLAQVRNSERKPRTEHGRQPSVPRDRRQRHDAQHLRPRSLPGLPGGPRTTSRR